MRRAQAILTIVALLAVPLALFARGEACQKTECPCCVTHPSKTHGMGMRCSHCASHGQCGISQPAPDYGVNSLMAPTAPLAFAALPRPNVTREALLNFASSYTAGFPSLPFEPPRA